MWFALGVVLAAVPMLAAAQSVIAVEDYGSGAFWAAANEHLVGLPDPGATMTLPIVMPEQAPSGAPFLGNGPNCARKSIAGGVRWTCSAAWGSGGATVIGSIAIRTSSSVPPVPCETGERRPDGTCFTCPPGRVWNGTTCESPCQAKAGNSVGTASSFAEVEASGAGTGATTFCAGECIAKGQKIECQSSGATTTGDYVSLGELCLVQGPFTYTGAACVDGPNNPGLVDAFTEERPWWDTGKDEKDCAASGGMPGQVGGVQVCLRPQNGETWDTKTETTTEPTKDTTTNPDGTTTEKSTTTTTSTEGGKTTTTTTTTTTTKDASGNTLDTSTETKVEEKSLNDFCKDNPRDAACVNAATDGAFGGGCDVGFVCTGDAVQCAIARAAYFDRCDAAKLAEENALSDLGGEGWAGAADITAEEEARALNRDGAFDFDIGEKWNESKQEYITFTKECISVPPIQIMGVTLEFDVGVLCDVGAVLRLFMHLLAYLGAIRMIVSKV